MMNGRLRIDRGLIGVGVLEGREITTDGVLGQLGYWIMSSLGIRMSFYSG